MTGSRLAEVLCGALLHRPTSPTSSISTPRPVYSCILARDQQNRRNSQTAHAELLMMPDYAALRAPAIHRVVEEENSIPCPLSVVPSNRHARNDGELELPAIAPSHYRCRDWRV